MFADDTSILCSAKGCLNRLALCNYLQTNVFYSINEFTDHVKGLKDKSK
jgi:hypothetical protein